MRMRPPTAGLSSVRQSACSLFMYQVRVWALGLSFAFVVVDLADLGEVLVLQAVALVVLVAELSEELREGELDALGLLLVPGRRAQVGAALGGRDRLHLLDADDGLQVVASGLDLGRGRQQRDAARRAGRLVAPVGRPLKAGWTSVKKAPEVALHAVELGGEVADVSALDLLGRDLAAARVRPSTRLAHQRREVLVLLRPVAGEVGLVSTENVDFDPAAMEFSSDASGILESVAWDLDGRAAGRTVDALSLRGSARDEELADVDLRVARRSACGSPVLRGLGSGSPRHRQPAFSIISTACGRRPWCRPARWAAPS